MESINIEIQDGHTHKKYHNYGNIFLQTMIRFIMYIFSLSRECSGKFIKKNIYIYIMRDFDTIACFTCTLMTNNSSLVTLGLSCIPPLHLCMQKNFSRGSWQSLLRRQLHYCSLTYQASCIQVLRGHQRFSHFYKNTLHFFSTFSRFKLS